MCILFVCNEYPPAPHGGIGVFIKTLAEALAENGHKVAILGYDSLIPKNQVKYENGVWVYRLRPKKYKSIKLGRFTVSLEPILVRRKLSKCLEKIVKTFDPDIIESYDWSGPLWKKPLVPLVIRMHGSNTAHQVFENKKPSKLLYYFERKNLQFADALCAVSHHIGKLTLKSLNLSDRSYHCLYNFVDTEVFKPDNSVCTNKNKLLYVGRIHPRKGLKEFFNILRELFQINDNLFIELVGPYQEEYKNYLLSLISAKFRNRVKFLGKIPHNELPELYGSACLFLMPSRAEAFGLTAIEAMACGTPVFLTDRASGPEIVQDGITGWLFNIDHPKESAKKINNVLSNSTELTRVAKKGRVHVVENFSKKVWVRRNMEFYTNLVL